MTNCRLMASLAKPMAFAAIVFATPCLAAAAPAIESAYTKVDENTCKWDQPAEGEDEAVDGGCATCPGHGAYIVRLCESDLRQSVFYGSAIPEEMSWNSFGQFNHAGPTVEWRLSFGEPYAAIHRFFIENSDDNGDVTPQNQGQVLVISTVAGAFNTASCAVGYVDARANPNPNELARQVADELAMRFECGKDRPQFHGVRGPLAGNPTGLDE